MPLLEIQGVSDPQLRRGLGALNSFAESSVYRRLEPVPQVLTGGAVRERVTISGTLREMAGVRLPAAGTPIMTGSWEFPSGIIQGALGLEILYTGTTADTNTINLPYNMVAIAIGDVLPAGGTLATATPPGPASAGALLKASVGTLIQVDASTETVGWSISRSNPDAYGAGEVYILGVRPLWYPRKA